jgi:hypothetical protein
MDVIPSLFGWTLVVMNKDVLGGIITEEGNTVGWSPLNKI